ncbi:hypothetical protein AB4072_05970 [Microvirga sp. 2MCAF38]|uniref:hypothetical protein n=1 Tax=Microvirga sp. 2MCAF38 TaxID=3232989 RepID=UPI003F9E810F
MRYDEAPRARSVEHLWLRLKLWIVSRRTRRIHGRDLLDLTDHERRDIGLNEPVRFADWKSLERVLRP